MVPVGKPVRDIYALLPWAREKGCETRLLSQALHLAFGKGVGLHRRAGLRAAVERAGLSWTEAQANFGNEDWKTAVAAWQREMLDDLGLWGVPSYRLQGGGAEDLCVWGQDRLWLVAAEMKKRAENNG
jgi:2-hydroxychromene-2-carboxylate isomerase